MTPMVSWIVSACDRPDALRLCLSSLVLQTMTDWEAIVMDNSTDESVIDAHARHCSMDSRIRHFSSFREGVPLKMCYFASEYAVEHLATGEWVGFPSDDSYYVTTYAAKLLRLARENNFELVYSDLVMDGPENGGVLSCEARCCMIDKTNFLVKRSRFIPWPGKHPEGGGSTSDGMLIDALVAQGIRHGKVGHPLCVHM